MKQLEAGTAQKNIEKFLSGDESVILSSKEEAILKRWEAAHEMMIKKEKSWVEIRDKIAFSFSVSKHTAENDIVKAQEVFGMNRKANKRYLMLLHLDRLDRDYERARDRLFFYMDKETGRKVEVTPDAKELQALSRLADSYTYALNSVPEDLDRTKLPPPIFVFSLPVNQVMPQPMRYEDAIKVADEMNFTDFENVEDGDIQPDGSTGGNEDDAITPHDDPDSEGE